ncbi:MAG: MBL fold metallo-hydrolase [Bacteroidales bacterium]|nr:MBL fold metallo-hydrolase [Bacteroidales bacterium]
MKGARIYRFNDFQSNCIVLWDAAGKCVVVDPGFIDKEEKAELYDHFREEGLTPEKIFLTHGHFDHIYGVAELVKDYGIPVYMAPQEKELVAAQGQSAALFGLPKPDCSFETVDIADGEIVSVGDMNFKVIATPGHTPGGVCWYEEKAKLILTGDTLFAGSIGRTDMPGGDYDAIIRSLLEKLMQIDGDVDVLPGHGPYTTIADERTKNPFLQPFNEPYEEE